MNSRAGSWIVALAFLGGCTHVGPRTIPADRFDYSTALADSWKEQTLLNIVKLKYMDLPVFVEVASIVSSYSMQSGVNLGGTLSSPGAVQGDVATAGVQGIYTDRPTITYLPLTGEKFLRSLMTPMDPKNIFFMLQSGYSADFVLALTVESLNGVRNRSTMGILERPADPEFTRVLELLRDVQSVGGIGMRVEEDKVRGSTAVLFFRRDDMPAEIVEKTAEIRRLLRVPVDVGRLEITYSPVRGAENELAVNSRSMLQVMRAFASYIEVPEEHVNASRGASGATPAGSSGVRIHSGKTRPAAVFTAVHYRDYWFWIDTDDWETKRAMTAIVFFFTLADTVSDAQIPLITIPAQ